MNRYFPRNVVYLHTLLLFALLACACTKPTETEKAPEKTAAPSADEDLPEGLTKEQAAKVVAKVGDHAITVGDVTRQINNLSPYVRRRWAAPEKRREFLDKLIRVELLSQEAARLGLDDDPEVRHTVKQTMIRLMVKNDLEKNLLPSSVDEDLLKKEYEKAHDTYHRPEQVRASKIVLKTKGEADKLFADLKSHKEDGGYFRKKARELSTDEKTKDRGGDMGYFTRTAERRETDPVIESVVADTAWSIKNVGDLAEKPVKVEGGFAIVKLTNKRAAMDRSFESVKRILESRVLREKRKEGMDDFIEGLRNKAKIETYPDNFAQIKFDTGVSHHHRHETGPGARTIGHSRPGTPAGPLAKSPLNKAKPGNPPKKQ